MERTGDVSYESIRGTIIHEIIKTAIGGRPLPSVKAVAIALSREGTPKEYALQSASEILSEAERTVNSPFIAGLINNTNPLVKTECAIEDIPQEAHLRSGILDLLVFDGRSWWICDFKTARPLKDETVDAFVRREKELYRSQLAAYASMLASVNSIEERYIRKGIFLTAIRRWEEY
jgi:predicted RecB family nuclease